MEGIKTKGNKQISITFLNSMHIRKFIASSLEKLAPWKSQLKKVLTDLQHQLTLQRRPITSLEEIIINQLKQQLKEMRKQRTFLVRDAILHEEMMRQIKQQYCQLGNAMARLAQGLLHVSSSQSRIPPLISLHQRTEQIAYNYNLLVLSMNNQPVLNKQEGKQNKRMKNEQPSNQQQTTVIQKIQAYIPSVRSNQQFDGYYSLQKEEMFNQYIQNCVTLPSV